MKHLMSVAALFAACLSAPAFASSHKEAPEMANGASAPMSSQQSKMGACNGQAGEMKGDERKAFMKTCLSAKKPSQQEKMKSCNADPTAKSTHGDERKAFMKECLSK